MEMSPQVSKLSFLVIISRRKRLNSFEYIYLLFSVFDGDCQIEDVSLLNQTLPPDTWEYAQKCIKNVGNWTQQCISTNADEAIFNFNVDCLLAKECMCAYDNHAAIAIFDIGPYLYPFSIEFSILVGKLYQPPFYLLLFVILPFTYSILILNYFASQMI